MCNLCDHEKRTQEIKTLQGRAVRLRVLASHYDALADLRIQPHSEKAKVVGFLAKNLIRELVEEWV